MEGGEERINFEVRFAEEGIVANAEGREKTPELSRVQGPRPSRGIK
jgi:hypothetical protein